MLTLNSELWLHWDCCQDDKLSISFIRLIPRGEFWAQVSNNYWYIVLHSFLMDKKVRSLMQEQLFCWFVWGLIHAMIQYITYVISSGFAKQVHTYMQVRLVLKLTNCPVSVYIQKTPDLVLYTHKMVMQYCSYIWPDHWHLHKCYQ